VDVSLARMLALEILMGYVSVAQRCVVVGVAMARTQVFELSRPGVVVRHVKMFVAVLDLRVIVVFKAAGGASTAGHGAPISRSLS